MEFSIEKYVMLIMKSGKNQTIRRRDSLNLESIRTLQEKENNKFSGI